MPIASRAAGGNRFTYTGCRGISSAMYDFCPVPVR